MKKFFKIFIILTFIFNTLTTYSIDIKKKYSDKYKKVFQFLINSTKEINLFKDIFLRYDVIYGISGLRDILNEMWNYGLRLDFING